MASEEQERMQDDLDFWRKRLRLAREEREDIDKTIAGYLDLINAVKIEAKLKKVEIQ